MTPARAAAVGGSLAVLCAALLCAPRPARADLYTDGVLSLEWLVDSSDEIHLVHVLPATGEDPFKVKEIQILKKWVYEPLTGEGLLREIWRRGVRWSPPKEEADWLLFVRRDGLGDVFRGINLTDPLKSYTTAAVTREGKPLTDRQAILDAVNARIRLDHRLPPGADRRAVDTLAGNSGNAWTAKRDIEVGCTYLKAHYGGTLIQINCSYWDTPGPNSLDTILTRAVIPLEPGDHARLLQATGEPSHSAKRSEFCHPVMALVNFPGEETEARLRQIITNRRPGRYDEEVINARDALRFLTYHLKSADPENRALVGRWRLEGHRETIDVVLTPDHTFVASAFTRSEPDGGHRHLWDGQGRWMVHDHKLSIIRTHSREGLSWHPNPREFFRDKKIKEITPTAVVLDGGPPMKRQ